MTPVFEDPGGQKWPWWRLAAYGFPSFALAALTLPVYILLPTYYANGLGLGLGAVGVALAAARLFDVLSDPLIGWLSDRTRTPEGRRRPYIIAGMPLVLAGSWFLLNPPESAGIAHLILWSVVLYAGWTMMLLPLAALGAEMSEDYDERSRISGWREGFTVLGTLGALGLAGIIGVNAAGNGSEAGNSGAALLGIAWLAIVTLPIGVALLWRFVPETPYSAPPGMGWRKRLAAVFRNGPFRRLMIAYLINGIANGLPATLFVLFVERVLNAPEMTGPLLFLYFLSGVLFVPVWLKISYRLGKHRTWCWAMVLACAVFLPAPFLSEGQVWAFAAICVLSGLCLGADLTLPASMQADVVDLDRAETGEQRAGLFFSAWSMSTKLSLALAVGIAFPVLELLGVRGDQAGTEADIEMIFGTIHPVGLLYGIAPLGFKAVAIAMMWRFPLDRKRQRDLIQRAQTERI